ncbi:MAG: GNAT family N-acetyltransferase [Deltaproteobacteria bacterium]|nr:GNAT family N-acetyltransferase [Deltaproteobacteria bacterium]
MELIFQEGDYLIKTLSTHEEMEEAFRLRHEVFVDELKWVPASPDGMEKDRYDAFADSLGVFDADNRLVGHVRLIPAPLPFMVEKEFACLLPKDKPFIKVSKMAECTRICVKKNYRAITIDSSLTLGHLLYKAVYQWGLMQDVKLLAAVVERGYYHYLKSFFPFELLGNFSTIGDGVKAGVITVNWRSFEVAAREKRPEFLQWMTNLPALVPAQWLRHALY